MIVNVPHPFKPEGAQILANPVKLSDTPIRYDKHPPLLGQHNSEVLKETLGMEEEKIEMLRKKQILK